LICNHFHVADARLATAYNGTAAHREMSGSSGEKAVERPRSVEIAAKCTVIDDMFNIILQYKMC
jgi:hypothetical protein